MSKGKRREGEGELYEGKRWEWDGKEGREKWLVKGMGRKK